MTRRLHLARRPGLVILLAAAIGLVTTRGGILVACHSHEWTALPEDDAELIADLLATRGEARAADIARRRGASHVTAVKSIGRMKREGLAMSRPYRGVFLSEAGCKLAEVVRSRHRIMVDLLVAVGVPLDAAESDAECMEHHVSNATLTGFERFLRAER